MTNGLMRADRVLMVCTPNYVKKADEGKGGAETERMIVTAEYLENIDSNKVIPIIKRHGEKSVPAFFGTKLYIDFSKQDEFESSFDNLLREILARPLVVKPDIGETPFDDDVDVPAKASHDPVEDLMKLVAQYYENEGEDCITVDRLHAYNIFPSRVMTDIVIKQAVDRKYLKYTVRKDAVRFQHEGKLFVSELDD